MNNLVVIGLIVDKVEADKYSKFILSDISYSLNHCRNFRIDYKFNRGLQEQWFMRYIWTNKIRVFDLDTFDVYDIDLDTINGLELAELLGDVASDASRPSGLTGSERTYRWSIFGAGSYGSNFYSNYSSLCPVIYNDKVLITKYKGDLDFNWFKLYMFHYGYVEFCVYINVITGDYSLYGGNFVFDFKVSKPSGLYGKDIFYKMNYDKANNLPMFNIDGGCLIARNTLCCIINNESDIILPNGIKYGYISFEYSSTEQSIVFPPSLEGIDAVFIPYAGYSNDTFKFKDKVTLTFSKNLDKRVLEMLLGAVKVARCTKLEEVWSSKLNLVESKEETIESLVDALSNYNFIVNFY